MVRAKFKSDPKSVQVSFGLENFGPIKVNTHLILILIAMKNPV